MARPNNRKTIVKESAELIKSTLSTATNTIKIAEHTTGLMADTMSELRDNLTPKIADSVSSLFDKSEVEQLEDDIEILELKKQKQTLEEELKAK